MGRLRCLRSGWQVVGLALLFAASSAQAEGPRSLGRSTTGSLAIVLTILPHAQIKGPGTLQLSRLGGDHRATQHVCLSSNSPASSNMIAAIGSGEGGAFELSRGSDRVSYTVEWSSREQPRPSALTAGGSTRAELRPVASEAECASGSGGADLAIAIDPAGAPALRSGAPYTGTLTLVVAY